MQSATPGIVVASELDGAANLDEEIEPFLGAEIGLVAVVPRTNSITK